MKVRAKANGNIVDVSDGEAEALLASGIYEPVDEPKAKKSTKVEPMSTKDVAPLTPEKPVNFGRRPQGKKRA